MVNNALALGIKAPEIQSFNPLQAALVASQLRAADNQNALTQMQVSERTAQTNALADYRAKVAAGDPNADQALAGQPALMMQVIQARAGMKEDQRKTLDDNLLRNSQGAQRVLALPADQRQQAWTEELATALKEKRISPLQYERMKGMAPDEKLLTPIVKAGLSIESQISLEQKEKDRAAGLEFARGLTSVFAGGKPGAPAPAQPAGPGYFATLESAESGGNPNARPIDPATGKPASSAQGLFQFIKGTWANIATKYPDLDLKPEDRTATDEVAIAKQKKAARVLTAENAGVLVNGDIAPTDRNLYMAHFLGGDGAVKFLTAMKESPNAPAINFASKDAIEANKSVFYDKDGMPKTALGVYNSLTNKFAGSNTVATGAALGPSGQPAGATIAGIPAQTLIPILIQGAMQPGLPKESRDVASELLKTVLSESKPSETQKHYLDYVRQETAAGRAPKTMFEYEKELNASKSTKVNIDQKGEGAFETKFGGEQAERWSGFLKTADAAQRQMVDIQNMREISRRVGSMGATADFKSAIGPYAEALGVNVDKLSDIQAFTSIIERLTPQQRAPGSGATSDIEYKGFKKALPGLTSTPEAREAIMDTMEALARHSLAEGDIASRLATKEITRTQAEKELRALPDPLDGFKKWRQANPGAYASALNTPATAALPEGAPPLPDGFTMVK